LLTISSAQRRALRARAHALQPIVQIGDKGLSEAVIQEISASLDSHELIKVRAASADRASRNALLTEICERLGAAPVQHIGKILAIYRPAPDAAITEPPRKKPATGRRTKRQHQSS
jgi:RNA-binding protein